MFAAAMLNLEHDTFIIHIASLGSAMSPSSTTSFSLAISHSSILLNVVHLSCKPQIAGLIIKNTSIKIPDKYTNFANIFSLGLASKLLEYTKINKYTIKLVSGQQPPYGLIYSLGPVKLEILKAYIETNLANNFIRSSKALAGTPILFNQKSDSFFKLCVNYRGFIISQSRTNTYCH